MSTPVIKHTAWLRGESSGEQLVWSELSADERASLRSADLSYADLRDADLSHANLRGANLRGADLSHVNLSVASLSGANLSVANGIVELPVADPRGYRLVAVLHGDAWMLFAGCRGPWTTEQARAHWGAPDYVGDQLIARRYLHALDWWEQRGEEYRVAAGGGQ